MRTRWWMLLAAVVSSSAAKAQDALKVAADHYQVKVENEHVRVIENTLKPSEKDAMHTHPRAGTT